MSENVEIHIGNNYSFIKGNYDKGIVEEATSYTLKGAEYSKQYQSGRWDGKTKLANLKQNKIPTGLVPAVKNALEAFNHKVTIVDERTDPRHKDLWEYNDYKLNGYDMTGKRDYQAKAVESALHAKRGILDACTGCHAKGQQVVMYDGSLKKVEDVVVGDLLAGPDSTPRKVLSLVQGYGRLVKIVPHNGKPFVVSDEHLLTLQTEHFKIKDFPVVEYEKFSKRNKQQHKLIKSKAVEFSGGPKLLVPPYYMGIALCIAEFKGTKLDTFEVDFADKPGKFKYGVAKLGLLGVKDQARFIPESYFQATVAERLELLAGFMDASYNAYGLHAKEIIITRNLVSDFQRLCSSVGLRATACSDIIFRKERHNPLVGMRVYGDLSVIPCKLHMPATNQMKTKRWICSSFNIEEAGNGDYYGFILDQDQRYLLDDFTVTHNSGKTAMAAAIIQGLKLPTLYVVPSVELLNQTYETFKKALQPKSGEIGRCGDGKWDPGTWVTIAIADTLESRREEEEGKLLLSSVDVLFADECFPAGTKVDGRNIEDLKVGDRVSTIDHCTGKLLKRKIVRLFKKEVNRQDMVTVVAGGQTLTCTANHPVFVKNKGYIRGDEIKAGDMLCMSREKSYTLLQAEEVSKYLPDLFQKDNSYSSYSRVGATVCDNSLSLLPNLCSKQSEGDIKNDESSSSCKGRERDRSDSLGERSDEGTAAFMAYNSSLQFEDKNEERVGLSDLLQTRSSHTGKEDIYRGRWSEPLRNREAETRSEENGLLEWARVESVSREEQGLGERLFVYNIEVEGSHTYFANGVLVHNCHLAGAGTWYSTLMKCNAYYRYGISGTPLSRGDGASLNVIALTGEVFHAIKYKTLVEAKILPKASIIFDKVTLPQISPKIRDWRKVYSEGITKNEHLNEKVLKWVEYAHEAGLSTLVLVDEINHGKAIDEALWKIPGKLIPHQFIHGAEKGARPKALLDFEARRLPVLIASRILDTGVSLDNLDCLILASSGKSKIRTLQRLGRALRGKKAIVIDFVNMSHKFLAEHSMQRLADLKEQDCFRIIASTPSVQVLKREWDLQG